MNIKKNQIIVSIIVLICFVFGMYLIRKDRGFETRHSKGLLRNLYQDSLENKILEVDYFLRADHVILDNNYEYFMTNATVRSNERLRGVLKDWISPGDSIYKNTNENWFVAKKSNGQELVIFFE